ncbi:MAG TPA: DUF5615 family PIN-like protein [Blastocatellia bacterium]|nr:DUF5615 family PIN-like protein [Blastocatellia bacterium]
MSLKLYMDVQVPYAITRGLRLRSVDVMTSQDDNTTRLSDPRLLDRATELGRVLFTQDEDLLAEADKRQEKGREFAGVIYMRQRRQTLGQCIDELELISGVYDPKDMANRVEYLPLK